MSTAIQFWVLAPIAVGIILLIVGTRADREARRDMLDDGYDRRRNSRIGG